MEKWQKWLIGIVSVIFIILLGIVWFIFGNNTSHEELHSQNTKFRMFGADNTIATAYFSNSDLPGVSCYITRANTGGIKGSLGIAEDTAHATLTCFQSGKIDTSNLTADPVDVYKERRSIGFKKLKVIRYYIKERNDLVFITYSDKILDGDNENSSSGFHINNKIFDK